MKVKILGCSGGIGGSHLRTTSMLVDDDILIDAGTGVGDLSVEELARIDHVFVTHSHLDHIACLPFILDTVGDMRDKPLTMHATRATQEIIRTHIFNWSIWPDFSQIPNPENPFLRFHTIHIGEDVTLGGRTITALPARHTVPAVGYRLDSGRASLVFTGDTTSSDDLWKEINNIGNLRYLLIETAFSDSEHALAILSKHLCPSMLGEELGKLRRNAEIFITHLKPGQAEATMREIEQAIGEYHPRMLQNNQLFEF
jgi:ribonuclease BN (tRNA processing enzyme)